MPNKIIFIILLCVICIFSFSAVFAADFDYKYPWAGETTPAGLVNKIYLYALGVVGAIAMGVLVYGGILHTISAGNSSKQQDAKEWITGAIWGLALLLGAYLILWTINPDLVSLKDPEVGKIASSGSQQQTTSLPTGTKWPVVSPPPGTLSDTQARNTQGISVNKSNCIYVGQTNCTSLDGLSQSIIDNTLILQKAAGVPIVITGGTEYWLHSENTKHVPGGSAVDYRYDDPAILEAVKKSEQISYYQCENKKVKVYGCVGTIDHIHVEYK